MLVIGGHSARGVDAFFPSERALASCHSLQLYESIFKAKGFDEDYKQLKL